MTAQTASSSASSSSSPELFSSFPIGTRVILRGLQNAPEHNGKLGVVQSPLNSAGRQGVLLMADSDNKNSNNASSSSSRVMGLRTANLELAPRPVESLSVKELKIVWQHKQTVGGDETSSGTAAAAATTGMSKSDLIEAVFKHNTTAAENAEILRAKAAALAAPYSAITETNSGSSTAKKQSAATTGSSTATNTDPSTITPQQLRQQAAALRSMDPATVRRMNPALAGMSDQQIRQAADQMELAASNPAMLAEAQRQQQAMMNNNNKNSNNNGTTTSATGAAANGMTMPTNPQDQIDMLRRMSPEQLQQQADLMKNTDPATLRLMHSQFATMSNEQIQQAAAQMQLLASNPAMLNMVAEQMKNMSPEEIQAMQQSGGRMPASSAAANNNPANNWAASLANMDAAQLKEMIKTFQNMRKQVMGNADGKNRNGPSEQQVTTFLDAISNMDDQQLERVLGVLSRATSAWQTVNQWTGGHLRHILILGTVGLVVWVTRRLFSGGVTATMGDEDSPFAPPESFQQSADINEFQDDSEF